MNHYETPGLVMHRIEAMVKWLGADIAQMEHNQSNVGYPILFCIFAQIDYIASIIYMSERSGRVRVGKYFKDFMQSEYRSLYGLSFPYNNYCLGNSSISNFGELLYVAVRCKLVHETNVFLPFSVSTRFDPKMKYSHLSYSEERKLIVIHAYEMNKDYLASKEKLFMKLSEKAFLDRISTNLSMIDTDLNNYMKQAECLFDMVLSMGD